MSQSSQLEVQGVTLTFGGINALTDVSLTVPPGEIVSIIGPNGAGKTSLLNCISGFYHPTRGRITFGHHDLSRAAPNVVTGYGIARAFQNLELFRGLSVVENMLLARHTHLRYGLLSSLAFTAAPAARRPRTAPTSSASSTSWNSNNTARTPSARWPTASRNGWRWPAP
ncbi:ATP-binding cassette domain-containing protein [Deinococcus radiopugnans]|uniref:ATP-binding cassette domain-containing protein n=1 Tax=Deinococcus radiopugnans TaxID=57497 RepID=UPI003618C2DA